MNWLPLQISVFILMSGVLTFLSRKSLRSRTSHGFTRFFAWEAILALLVWNAPVWHDNMFSIRQLASWALLFTSPVVAISGLRALQAVGKTSELRQDDALFGFERTGRLVTTSIFGFIRHPMYSALILLAWGIYLKGVNPWTTVLVVLASLAMWFTARRDEAECMAYFGEAYGDYMKTTKRFVPYLL
ncbi:isoprenylcysteine carboxyl methyltransferase [Hydrogenophaga crassostreae]|nr:isoprenylcysteine carboxyl methyltransferase [Hydrogenophaga crassostreae]